MHLYVDEEYNIAQSCYKIINFIQNSAVDVS